MFLKHFLKGVAGFWAFFAITVGANAWAQELQPIPELRGRVVDQALLLGSAGRTELSERLAALEERTGTQLVVLIVPSTQPEDVASYANRVGQAWKLGRKAVGDGLLLVIAVQDRRLRLEVAKNLEGAIPDLAAKRIVQELVAPQLKANNAAAGMLAAVDEVERLVKAENLPAPGPKSRAAAASSGFDWADLGVFLFAAVFVLGTGLRSLFGRGMGSVLTGGAAGGVAWWITASLGVAIGAGVVALFVSLLLAALSWGRQTMSGMQRRGSGSWRSSPVAYDTGGSWGGGSSGDDGGSFSSGGGGDFGGGGASGDW